MLIRQICSLKLSPYLAVICSLVAIVSVGKAQDDAANAQKSDVAKPIALVVPNFKNASDDAIFNMSNSVYEQQEFIRRTLLDQLQDENISPLARTETISLLGIFPPRYDTISALIQNLDVIANYRSDTKSLGGDRFRGFIARHVLVRMGIPAEEEIMGIIGSQRPTDMAIEHNPALGSYSFDLTKAEGFADVLTQIEGKQGALLKLQKEQSKSKNPAIKAQFQAVIEVVKKGAALAPRNKY